MTHLQRTLYSIIFLFISVSVFPQTGSFNSFGEDETILYTMNKQVGQFVRRFNMEEDSYGKRLATDDKKYHNNKLREEMLPILFDTYNPRTSGKLKQYFIDDVTDKSNPVFLNFLDKNWYAEVSATFTADGAEVNIILFLTLQEENLGSKWVISNVYYSYFPHLFPHTEDSVHQLYFLHPQSHELDFMNLHRALDDPAHIELYASNYYRPDYLTLFFYQMKMGQLKFKEINSVKFHFFQVKNWYFELSYFNRNDTNSGWLISNLKFVNDEEKKELIKSFKLCAIDK
ncbi:MAG: hypothetical protein DRI88_01860 [Bacteroidetes bacterium]|nr:MAG: hypothetical protein DRI88_01860 [Bacteroidota bacterium]RLD84578.1 MAG: hypothetical protein DRJ02_11715 [Bacteroidota bacterium]